MQQMPVRSAIKAEYLEESCDARKRPEKRQACFPVARTSRPSAWLRAVHCTKIAITAASRDARSAAASGVASIFTQSTWHTPCKTSQSIDATDACAATIRSDCTAAIRSGTCTYCNCTGSRSYGRASQASRSKTSIQTARPSKIAVATAQRHDDH